MKKTRFLVLALAVAIMMVGAGYAWWSETVTVTTNVSTGALDVDIVGTSSTHSDYVTVGFTPSTNVADPNDTDALKIDIGNLYPGANGKAVVSIKNTGTIPVKMQQGDVACVDGDVTSPDGVNVAMTATISDTNSTIQLYPEVRNGHTYYHPGNNSPDITAAVGGNITLNIEASLGTADVDSELKNVTMTLNPTFDQFNK